MDGIRHLQPASVTFCILLLVAFTDNLGIFFCKPIAVPYVFELGGNVRDAAFVMSLNAIGKLVGGAIIPVVADSWTCKGAIGLTMLGSCAAYSLAGSAYFASLSGLSIYLCGRTLGGFFSGNMSLCVGMVIRTCYDDLALLKMRTTMLRASSQATGIALAPLGGAIAVYGLYLPYYTSAAIALVSAMLVAGLLIDDRDTDDGDGKAMGKRGGEHGGHGGRGGRGGRVNLRVGVCNVRCGRVRLRLRGGLCLHSGLASCGGGHGDGHFGCSGPVELHHLQVGVVIEADLHRPLRDALDSLARRSMFYNEWR